MNITLDVQGQIFKTKYENILKIPYFKDMFETCGQPSETIFVDRPPHIFKHVLSLIVDNFYPYPEKYKFELDFYGIEYGELKFYGNETKILIKAINDASYIKCNSDHCTMPVLMYTNCKMKYCESHCNRYICNRIGCKNQIEQDNLYIMCSSCLDKYT
jgi:hypothetical protein